MEKTARDKLSGAICDFLRDLVRIADEEDYDRDSFVRTSADMFSKMAEISTFERFDKETYHAD